MKIHNEIYLYTGNGILEEIYWNFLFSLEICQFFTTFRYAEPDLSINKLGFNFPHYTKRSLTLIKKRFI